MSCETRSASNRMSRMIVHPYKCVQLFHKIGPIGLFLKYLSSFTFRDEDDDDDDSIQTHTIYAKLLHLPDGHTPSIVELKPMFAALEILNAWSPEDRTYYLRRGLRWNDKNNRLFSFFLRGLSVTHEVAICFMPKTKEHQWCLCILVDKVSGGKIDALLEACEVHIDGRRTHIEHNINAFL